MIPVVHGDFLVYGDLASVWWVRRPPTFSSAFI
jgi:hypothetical protein